jgi:hypothetical protein
LEYELGGGGSREVSVVILCFLSRKGVELTQDTFHEDGVPVIEANKRGSYRYEENIISELCNYSW